MPVTDITTDNDALTITIVADFDVPRSRLWYAYADPRQLEKFWGPVDAPATFTRHDLFPGGQSLYSMTVDGGEKSMGYWQFTAVTPGESFEVLDGFRRFDGTANDEMPTMRMVFTFADTDSGSQLTTVTHVNSAEELAELQQMGMEEGTRSAMSQIDGVVADDTSYSPDLPVQASMVDDELVRFSRVIDGTLEDVWSALHHPEKIRGWQTGPEGWAMTECIVAAAPGETYHYEWREEEGEGSTGITGEMIEATAPYRDVATEHLVGQAPPPSINELTLTEVAGGVLLTLIVNYPNPEIRQHVLDSGAAAGMETSYARMESDVLSGRG